MANILLVVRVSRSATPQSIGKIPMPISVGILTSLIVYFGNFKRCDFVKFLNGAITESLESIVITLALNQFPVL